jgi:hypothetical protein
VRTFADSPFLLGLLVAAHTAIAAEVSTVDFTNPAVYNSPTVNPAPRCQERISHYFIGDTGVGAGMLSIASQWKCDTGSGHASGGICQLDQTLKCRSDIQFRDKSGKLDLAGYGVTPRGVTANGEFHPWVDPHAAAPILSMIQNPALNPVARQEVQNQAVLNKMGGTDNFMALLAATGCRYASRTSAAAPICQLH